MAKTESLDCVEVKRRAQRDLVKALAGHSPAEQVDILRRLAQESPVWKKLRGTKRNPPTRSIQVPPKQRKTG